MKMKFCSLSLMLCLAITGQAQNPIIRDQFAADPTARVFNNRVYVYPSHDIPAPEGQRQDWFCMADYHVFSSDNLTDWTDHGVIVSQEQVPWGKADAYSMWAPDCVEKNGRYYFYFPNAPRSGRGFAIGVAVSDAPTGPFRLETEPIRGVSGIDPCVLLDDDGTAYLYWSGMGIRGARLKDNMTELADELQTVTTPQGGSMQVGGRQMEGLPEGFKEGPFAFKRDGWYYLTFPWVRQENGTETLAYAMARSPLGPWDFKGIIMAEHANRCWTNHHSIVEFKGQWYIFYHHNDYSPQMDKRRSARIERISFNPDGTIQEVKPTHRGVGITAAASRIEVDRYSALSEGASIAFVDSLQPFRGWYVSLPVKGAWVSYGDVDFSCLGADAYVVAHLRANANTQLSIREASAKGRIMAEVPIIVESQQGTFRRDQRGQWLTLALPLSAVPKGCSTLVVTCEGDAVDIDWLQFKNKPLYFTPVDAKAPAVKPDERGFIRRWKLMEPLPQDIRSNIVFTDSWLRDKFAEAQQLQRNGKRKWYILDSGDYNFRLFHFAEKWGKQTYGNLFCGTTVIECAEDIEGVRLAAGSNGASMWWLNDEEVLLLSGDRRMVEDDGVSPRLTLHKGRNTLRFALVNGPGLSDFCARFIDERGIAIKNYTIVR
ncbi:MAG: family 43 glycosylhydrolase [Bacteroidaceae bacterium]|nr:family 43 glycosylhydrolase [Bacteroidaceae bacterium]